MKKDKFLYIKEGNTEGTLLAEDGGVATIWHNGEHIVGQCYRERLESAQIEKGLAHAFDYMAGRSSNSSMFDFEEEDNILPDQIEQMADWLVSPRKGEFLENLTFLETDKLSEKELDDKVKEFLKVQ